MIILPCRSRPLKRAYSTKRRVDGMGWPLQTTDISWNLQNASNSHVPIQGTGSILNISGVFPAMAQSPTNPDPVSTIKKPIFRPRLPLGWLWPMVWSGLMVASGFLGVWAIAWLTRIPPLPDCEAVTVSSVANNRLICAQANLQIGTARELIDAIQLTAHWSESHALYPEADAVLKEASLRLLKKASQEMHQGNLDLATDWASQIPLDTPLRQRAQANMWTWQQEWKQGQALADTIIQAIRNQDWKTAEDTLQRLKLLTSDYWLRQRHSELQQTQQREQAAWAQIAQARALAATGAASAIGQALQLAQKVDLTSQAWATAQDDIDRWSQHVLKYAFQQWELGNVEGAIAAAQQVPPDPTLVPQAQDLIQFSHARQLGDRAQQQQQPDFMQLLYLMEAIRAVEGIERVSPVYEAAQVFLKEWQAQLTDLRTLQFANVIAGLQQPWAYRYATALAWDVDPDRPRRLQAQTLIAHWEDEIERIEDRPYLMQARALSQPGTIPAFQSAIAAARHVTLGRALRIEAQTLIAEWAKRIEVIEDQPILRQATTLAAAGDFQSAIETAQDIGRDRALYEEALAMVADWTRTVQIQEDRPIFEEAKALAYRGSLTRAINLASQIAPGRALHPEVQTAISLWEAERAYIWQQRAAAEAAAARRSTRRDSAPPADQQPDPEADPAALPSNQRRPPTSSRSD